MLKVLGDKRLQLLFPKNGELVLLFRGGLVMRLRHPLSCGAAGCSGVAGAKVGQNHWLEYKLALF